MVSIHGWELERYFGSEAQGWLNLQAAYDLRIAEKRSAKAIFKEIAPLSLKANNGLLGS
jgi:plasmid maintenance system antidote protein VapI